MSGAWTSADDGRLLELVRLGLSERQIGERMGRTWRSINSRRLKLRAPPEQRERAREQNRFAARDRRALQRLREHRVKRGPARETGAPRWFGRCPAFRPRTDADANRTTRL